VEFTFSSGDGILLKKLRLCLTKAISNFFLSTLKYMFNAQITKSAKLDFCSAKKEKGGQAKKK
jgi:hypothetical protein